MSMLEVEDIFCRFASLVLRLGPVDPVADCCVVAVSRDPLFPLVMMMDGDGRCWEEWKE